MRAFRQTRSTVAPRSAQALAGTRRQLDWPANRDFRLLAIDGGGIRGILPLAFLANLEGTFLAGSSIVDYFDMVVGTSTGGIIALGLGAEKTASELFELYLTRGAEVFPDHSRFTKVLLNLSHLFVNRCDARKLHHLIDEILGNKRLWESQTRLCIPSAETHHFEPVVYKTPHHPDYKLDWEKSMSHVAKATSAAPSFYSPVSDTNYEFIDGGVWANCPVMVGIADVLACYAVPRNRIKVLSIGCVRDQHSMGWARRSLGGKLFWTSVMFESMHLAAQSAIGQARLIVGGDHVIRVDGEPVFPPLELWDWRRCKELLPSMADDLFGIYGEQIAAEFLREPAEPFRPFYPPQ